MLAKISLVSHNDAQILRSLVDYATWPARSEDERKSATEFLRDFIPSEECYLDLFLEAYDSLVCDYFKVELCDLFARLHRYEMAFLTKSLLNNSTNPHVRFHAAVALARLGIPEGYQFIESEFMRNIHNPYETEVVPENIILSTLRNSLHTSKALRLAQKLEACLALSRS